MAAVAQVAPMMRMLRNKQEFDAYREAAKAWPRQYGQTTGTILMAIGAAMRNPGVEQCVHDDFPEGGVRWAVELQVRARTMIERLGLKNIEVSRKGPLVVLTSHNFGAADVPDDG